MRRALIANSILQIFDLVTTAIFWSRGATEANPLVLAIFEWGGLMAFIDLKLFLAAIFLALAFKFELVQWKLPNIASLAFAGIMAFVVVNNLVVGLA